MVWLAILIFYLDVCSVRTVILGFKSIIYTGNKRVFKYVIAGCWSHMPAIFMFLLVGIILCLPANFFPCHTLRASVDVFPKQIGSREVFPPTAGG